MPTHEGFKFMDSQHKNPPTLASLLNVRGVSFGVVTRSLVRTAGGGTKAPTRVKFCDALAVISKHSFDSNVEGCLAHLKKYFELIFREGDEVNLLEVRVRAGPDCFHSDLQHPLPALASAKFAS